MTLKHRIETAFSAAAATYDDAAQAQQVTAGRLADLVLTHCPGPNPRVLEIGCGTGLLTRALRPRLDGDWLVTDLSQAMVDKAQTNLVGHPCRFQVMDGERPTAEAAGMDVIVSNLAVQWFHDLAGSLARLAATLRPGGILACSTMGAGSFVEWRDAHHALGLSAGMPAYPHGGVLAATLALALAPLPVWIGTEKVTVRHPDALAFVESLKRIGATTPSPGHRPLGPGSLRRVMRSMGQPVTITYEILYILAGAEKQS